MNDEELALFAGFMIGLMFVALLLIAVLATR